MNKRQTSVELLRVVAMLMVLTLHVNFMAIGSPSPETILSAEGIFRTVVQMLCVCAVDAFVMISGWFSIRPTIKGFINFMWQVFYFVALAVLINHFAFDTSLSYGAVFQCFGLFNGGGGLLHLILGCIY